MCFIAGALTVIIPLIIWHIIDTEMQRADRSEDR